MNVVRHLVIAHRMLYAWFWGVLTLLFTGMMASFAIFGHWVAGGEKPSAWQLAGTQAPLWFLFVMGIMLASARLPVAIANGVTRRDFSAGASVFALGSAVFFGLLTLAGYGGEILVYRAIGMMDELTVPYPFPSVGSFARDVTTYLAFMLSGWLIALCYYRLPVWWAIAVTPIAVLPMAGGSAMTYVPTLADEFGLWLAIVVVAALASYPLVRSVPVRPRKT